MPEKLLRRMQLGGDMKKSDIDVEKVVMISLGLLVLLIIFLLFSYMNSSGGKITDLMNSSFK